MIEIKRWDTGAVIYTSECATLREAVIEAVKAKADLSGANLSGVNLSGANLYRADLFWANLSRANLSGANLFWANLSGATLSGVNLSGADLSGVNLSGADLSGAKEGSVCRMDFGCWSICIRAGKTSIGCQCHGNKKWLAWTPKSKELCAMHEDASAWWTLHGPAVKAAIRVVQKKAKMEGKK